MGKVEIITIGDELLIGQVIDTNSAWMARELNNAGLQVSRITSVSDREDEILNGIREASQRSSVLLLTGGLGPTKDDITKAALCKYFDTQLVFNPEVFEDIKRFLKGRIGQINQLNRDQALVPESCIVVRNPVGTAPVMWFDQPNFVVVAMPGVPSEMRHAMSQTIIPWLQQRLQTTIIRHRTVHIFNIPEAVLAEMLSSWEDNISLSLKVAYLPSPGKLRLRLSGEGTDLQEINGAIDHAVQALYPIIGDHIFGFDDDTPAGALLNLLTRKHQTIACAESCSGGYIAHLITSIPGASKVFKGGVVAYANEAKTRQLNVVPEAIDQYGAVSRQVVEQMVIGAAEIFGTDYAIATSGIAGPSGGTAEKPAGTVWIAWYGKGKIISREFKFGNYRERTIVRTAEAGIIILKQFIEKGKFLKD